MHFPKLDKKSLTDGIVIPQFVKVHQSFKNDNLADPVATLQEQLLKLDAKTIASVDGKRIGISAGSRGVPYYKELMKTLCDQLKAWGASPFVFPAMGSHAGATGEGQKVISPSIATRMLTKPTASSCSIKSSHTPTSKAPTNRAF